MSNIERFEETDDEVENDRRLTIFKERWDDVMGVNLEDKIEDIILNNSYHRSIINYKSGFNNKVINDRRRGEIYKNGVLCNSIKSIIINKELKYKDISPRQERFYLKDNKEITYKKIDINNYRLKNGFYSRYRNKTIKNYFKKLKVDEIEKFENDREKFIEDYDGFYNLKKIIDVYNCDDVCCSFCGRNKKCYELNFVGSAFYDELREEDKEKIKVNGKKSSLYFRNLKQKQSLIMGDDWMDASNNILFKTYFLKDGNTCLICDGCREFLKDADPVKHSNFYLMYITNLFKNDFFSRCSCCKKENIYSQWRFQNASLYGDMEYNFIRDLEGEKSFLNGDNINGSIYSFVEYTSLKKFIEFLIKICGVFLEDEEDFKDFKEAYDNFLNDELEDRDLKKWDVYCGRCKDNGLLNLPKYLKKMINWAIYKIRVEFKYNYEFREQRHDPEDEEKIFKILNFDKVRDENSYCLKKDCDLCGVEMSNFICMMGLFDGKIYEEREYNFYDVDIADEDDEGGFIFEGYGNNNLEGENKIVCAGCCNFWDENDIQQTLKGTREGFGGCYCGRCGDWFGTVEDGEKLYRGCNPFIYHKFNNKDIDDDEKNFNEYTDDCGKVGNMGNDKSLLYCLDCKITEWENYGEYLIESFKDEDEYWELIEKGYNHKKIIEMLEFRASRGLIRHNTNNNCYICYNDEDKNGFKSIFKKCGHDDEELCFICFHKYHDKFLKPCGMCRG
mgnify:CR=1 FL=1